MEPSSPTDSGSELQASSDRNRSHQESEEEDPEVGDGHYDPKDEMYRLVSRRSYKPGDQVFLCYGRHTNLELLEHYGFMLDNNPHGMDDNSR